MSSAIQKPEVVREYLITECMEGRVIGPLDPEQFSFVHICPFGVIPKGSSGNCRRIVDLSFPRANNVNYGVDKELCALKYVTVDEAVRAIQKKGPGTQLAKIDISDVPIPLFTNRYLRGI